MNKILGSLSILQRISDGRCLLPSEIGSAASGLNDIFELRLSKIDPKLVFFQTADNN
jgi:hypothetical protein